MFHPYKKDTDIVISLNVGDIITYEYCKDVWFYGRNLTTNQVGFYPSNCVKPYKD